MTSDMGDHAVSWEQKKQAATLLCAQLRDAGFQALFAGGCVRDVLLNRAPQDIDIATNAHPQDIIRLFPKTVAVGAQFGVVIVVCNEGLFEIATFRKDGPYLDGRRPASVSFTDAENDARRRDFTINALFLDPVTDEVLDYVDGQADLRAGIVRAVGDARARFQEDYLRLLRAVRFAARLDFHIAPDTLAAMHEMADNIRATSQERIRDELLKMLTEGRARTALETLDATGLLAQILPEVTATHGVEQPSGHPEGDVWAHTLLMLAQLPAHVSHTLALAALLHDVGKPDTQTFEERIRFPRHEKTGAHMSDAIGRRLRLPKRTVQRVVWLVENHMRLKDFMNMRKNRQIRFARKEGFGELLALCRMDALASHGDTAFIDAIERRVQELGSESLRPPPLLTGRDLLAMGYAPGPRFREILGSVESLQLEGRLNDMADAKEYVLKTFPPTEQE